MAIDPRTPVLVGAAALQQCLEDPDEALEPTALMAAALERAAEDAGCRELLFRAHSIRIPRGLWSYPDPGRIVAARIGAERARSVVSEIGILQTTLFGGACRDIAGGLSDIILIAGGEAKYRSLRAKILGREEPLSGQGEDVQPDEVLRPHGDIISSLEIQRSLARPVNQYSVIENATRFAEGASLTAHREEVARMWSGFSDVAAANPNAWDRQAHSAEEIANSGPQNPMLAFPYTKLHCSQWNVDQAAGLILCSVEAARGFGISEERWIYPLAVTESNHMQPLSERGELHRCPGFRIAGQRALEVAGLEGDELTHLELYSCFPSAVRVQARELGISRDRKLSVSGGMAFGGGPLNNFVLQAVARMAQLLRTDPDSTGLVTAVSGILTKQGVSLWSMRPGPAPFRFEDVSDAVAMASESRSVDEHYAGPATIDSYTVLYEGGEPAQGLAICDAPGSQRAIASTRDVDLTRAMTREEFCGRKVVIDREGRLRLP